MSAPVSSMHALAVIDATLRVVIEKIHNTAPKCYVAVTGAGASSIGMFTSVAGSSRTLIEGVVPYARPALVSFLDSSTNEKWGVSQRTALCMARVAYLKGKRMESPETDAKPVVGIGCTAAIATDRTRKGKNQFFTACWSDTTIRTYHMEMEKEKRDRVSEDCLVCKSIVQAMADACSVITEPLIQETEPTRHSRVQCDIQWYDRTGTRKEESFADILHEQRNDPTIKVLFSGSFNPLHHGHLGMAAACQRFLKARHGEATNVDVLFEIPGLNADKGTISDDEIAKRVAQFTVEDTKHEVVITNSPLFAQKSRLFSGYKLLVGYDTATRILNPKYYNDSEKELLAAMEDVKSCGCSFLVCGRTEGGTFMSLDSIERPAAIPAELFEELFEGIPEAEFRVDVSSTELRAKGNKL